MPSTKTIATDVYKRQLLIARGLCALPAELGTNSLHLFARSGGAFPAVRCGIHQFFQVHRELRSKGLPNFSEQRLNLRESADVLSVGVIEKIQTCLLYTSRCV